MEKMRIDKKPFETPEVKSLLADALASLKADELVYPVISEELKLTNREAETYIGALLDYQEDVHYCKNCPGLEKCDKPHPHFSLRLQKDGNVVVRHYDPCEKMISLASFQSRYIRCSFPAEWRDESLKSIERSKSSRNPALLAMSSSLKGSGQWLYLTGKAGSGKTFMLACYANYLTLNKGKGAFCDTGSLLSELKDKSIRSREEFEETMKSLSSCSVLVLDDFGNEFKTEYVYTSILFPLLSARDKADLPTAFSSDFNLKQIVSMYQGKIGEERASQLLTLLKRRCIKEFDVSGISVH